MAGAGERALLRLLAWTSSGFPTGAYAYSHGLEWAVEAGDVRDAAALQEWLTDLLRHGAGRNDAILLRHAHRATFDPTARAAIAELAAALAPSRERLGEALDTGRAFAAAVSAWSVEPMPGGITHAVAFGVAAGRHGISEGDAVLGYLQSFTGNMISAAVRLVPLGQSAGLRVVAAIEPIIVEIAAATRGAALDDLGGCAFRADIAAMRHETQYTRLFRS